ncbi:hypothetical protein EBR66_01265 [bacterium]|nr:hypothetical protein [bacterium]
MVQGAQAIRDAAITYVIDPILMLMFSLGFFFFVLGIVEFLWKMKDGKVSEEGKEHMKWGLLGMVIMSSIWGIIALIDNSLGLNLGNPRNPNIDASQIPSLERIR